MGLTNGKQNRLKPKLSDDDQDYIAHQTSKHPSEVESKYEEFLSKHPNGKIRKQDFSHEIRSKLPLPIGE